MREGILRLRKACAEPVTLLVFDAGTPQQVHELDDNARLVSDCYRRLVGESDNESMALKYRVVFAVPDASGLKAACQDAAAELGAAGTKAIVPMNKSEDMVLGEGTYGLLASVLWCISGALLVNEVPISAEQAEKLLLQANQLGSHHLFLLKRGLFHKEYRLGLIRSAESLSYLSRGLLSRSSDLHSISEIHKSPEGQLLAK